MKEKIIRVIDTFIPQFDEDAASYINTRLIKITMAEELEQLVNQEVERTMEVERIKFLAGWIMRFKLHSDSSSFCNGFRNMEREYDELCSRLAQKTEGGGE